MQKKIVIAVALSLVAVSAVNIYLFVSKTGIEKLPVRGIRFLLTCLLAWYLYKGSSFARWFTILLIGPSGLFALIYFGKIPAMSFGKLWGLLLGAIYVASALLLIFPPGKDHFAKKKSDESAEPQ